MSKRFSLFGIWETHNAHEAVHTTHTVHCRLSRSCSHMGSFPLHVVLFSKLLPNTPLLVAAACS